MTEPADGLLYEYTCLTGPEKPCCICGDASGQRPALRAELDGSIICGVCLADCDREESGEAIFVPRGVVAVTRMPIPDHPDAPPGITVAVVDDESIACPTCGAFWGNPDPALDFPNRYRVDNFCRCYNPGCPTTFYDPMTGEAE